MYHRLETLHNDRPMFVIPIPDQKIIIAPQMQS